MCVEGMARGGLLAPSWMWDAAHHARVRPLRVRHLVAVVQLLVEAAAEDVQEPLGVAHDLRLRRELAAERDPVGHAERRALAGRAA